MTVKLFKQYCFAIAFISRLSSLNCLLRILLKVNGWIGPGGRGPYTGLGGVNLKLFLLLTDSFDLKGATTESRIFAVSVQLLFCLFTAGGFKGSIGL